MNRFKIGLSFVFVFSALLGLTNCSKKDVVEEEGLSAGSTQDTIVETAPVGTEGAGDAGESSGDFQTVYFDYDSYRLNQAALDALKANAAWLKDNPGATVQIEGHCDERGSTEYNLALGERRANAVKKYLTKLGVEGSRLSTISYGEERPTDAGHDEAAWSQNRRAQLVKTSN